MITDWARESAPAMANPRAQSLIMRDWLF